VTPRKEHDVTPRKRHFLLWLAVTLVAAAVTIPVAQAGGPDDRPLVRGSSAASEPRSLSPDDRPLIRGSSAASEPRNLSPDDRAYYRGTPIDHANTTAAPVSADDRSVPRGTDFVTRAVPVAVAVRSSHGFSWQDAAIGAAFGLLVGGLVLGALLFRQERRSSLKPA
jgi:hypothetical protein